MKIVKQKYILNILTGGRIKFVSLDINSSHVIQFIYNLQCLILKKGIFLHGKFLTGGSILSLYLIQVKSDI